MLCSTLHLREFKQNLNFVFGYFSLSLRCWLELSWHLGLQICWAYSCHLVRAWLFKQLHTLCLHLMIVTVSYAQPTATHMPIVNAINVAYSQLAMPQKKN